VNIQIFVCADEVVTGANNETELQRSVIEWASACREKGMENNAGRIKQCILQKEYRKD